MPPRQPRKLHPPADNIEKIRSTTITVQKHQSPLLYHKRFPSVFGAQWRDIHGKAQRWKTIPRHPPLAPHISTELWKTLGMPSRNPNLLLSLYGFPICGCYQKATKLGNVQMEIDSPIKTKHTQATGHHALLIFVAIRTAQLQQSLKSYPVCQLSFTPQ